MTIQHQSDTVNELAAALAKAQEVIKNPGLDSANPFYKSKYASLAAIIDTCKPIAQFGLSYSQLTTIIDDKFYLMTTLYHASGQWIRSLNPIICKDPSDPQKFGSAITYARRYALQSMLGIVGDEDDDGNSATVSAPLISVAQAEEINSLIGDDEELRKKIIESIRKETSNPKADISAMPASRLKTYLNAIAKSKQK